MHKIAILDISFLYSQIDDLKLLPRDHITYIIRRWVYRKILRKSKSDNQTEARNANRIMSFLSSLKDKLIITQKGSFKTRFRPVVPKECIQKIKWTHKDFIGYALSQKKLNAESEIVVLAETQELFDTALFNDLKAFSSASFFADYCEDNHILFNPLSDSQQS